MTRADDTEMIDTFTEFFQEYCDADVQALIEQYSDGERSLYVDWEDLHQFSPEVAKKFIHEPYLREYAEEALRLYETSEDVSLGQAHFRLTNLPETTPLGEIDADDRGTLVQFIGSVEKMTGVSPNITTAAFECQRCGTLTRIPQDGDLQKPYECQGCERQGPFRINYHKSKFIDAQRLYIKEFTDGFEDQGPTGVTVEIEDDITGEVAIGDAVIVTGMAQLKQEANNSNRFEFYIKGHSVQRCDRDFPALEITQDEKQKIIELSNQDDLYEQLVGSIAPTVYGKKMEKRALLFQLFDGVEKNHADGTQVRGSIHTLFVSDPGTFIERILKSAAQYSPNAVEVSGSETSSTGLTTSAVRSSDSTNSRGWEIEAGPLIKADQGHALINGIEDLGSGAENSLVTVMGQQSVDASKATASTSYSARTSIMAVGNPVYGRFDEYEPISNQIDLSGDLISAFDLILAITDQPDPREDEQRAERTLQTAKSGEIKTNYEETTVSTYSEEAAEQAEAEVSPRIDPELLRKYVTYAKENCYPTLSEDAEEKIKQFYVDVRSRGANNDAPVPISEQDLETLVRLAEASARMRLSDTVNEGDAERAIDMVAYMLEELGLDPATGSLDADAIKSKKKTVPADPGSDLLTEEMVEEWDSYRSQDQREIFRRIVEHFETDAAEGAPVESILEFAESVGMARSAANDEIDKLRQMGEVYEPKTNHLRTT